LPVVEPLDRGRPTNHAIARADIDAGSPLLRDGIDTAFNSSNVARPQREHRTIMTTRTCVALAAIYLAAVPWYAPSDWLEPAVWAFPAWAAVSVAASVVLAVYAARVFLVRWSDDPTDDPTVTASEFPD
jgi:hypothetical protein